MPEQEQLNLVQKLARIRGIADVAAKGKKGFNYKYSDIVEILAKVTAGLKKYEVSLQPLIVPGTANVEQVVTVNTKSDKTGNHYDQTTTEMLVKADMIFRWVNDANPEEHIDVPWIVIGAQSDPSQAFGSGLTYCERYFLCSYFQIAQPEDVDAYRSKQKEAEVSEDKVIVEGIIEKIDTLVKSYLAEHPDKAEEVKQFIGKYAKKSNYLAIKEPMLASKLLQDFTNTYIKTSKGE